MYDLMMSDLLQRLNYNRFNDCWFRDFEI